jgi:hypothetical protein
MILSMTEIDSAVRASWAADTCSDDDAARAPWTADNPAWGQCDVTALVLHDILGGDLMVGEVHLNGKQHGYHWWNRLDTGVEIDLTREQFHHGQIVTPGRAVTRPPGPLRRRQREYELLRHRVMNSLGTLPDSPHRPDSPT